jgi:ribonuclease R
MLPVALSNGICSLNPKVDRLTLSAIMEFDEKAALVGYTLHKSGIRSCERLVYSDVSGCIEGTSPAAMEKYARLLPKFRLMWELAQKLKAKRTARGSIDFDLVESKIIVDDKGRPVDILPRERGVSDKLIEEFMLAANEVVAEHVSRLEKPFVYRVHESPDPAKVQNFLSLAASFGHHAPPAAGNAVSQKSLQALLDAIRGKPEEKILSSLLLRAMMKARYSESNLGHYGLAAEFYCHFTSPIRRYPDLVVHRVLTLLLDGAMSAKQEAALQKFVPDAAVRSSETEIGAVEAERDIDDLYKAIYMQRFIGESLDGVISSVAGFGLFVELPNTVEGLVSIRELDDDFYVYDEQRYLLKGERTAKTYRIGDRIRIRVVKADIVSRKIDFTLADD